MKLNWNGVEFDTSFGSPAQLRASTRPEIAFSGRSNVGKSSLINKLFNRKALARVSSTPGKTITINFFSVGDVSFVDLPGYGYAKRPDEQRRRWSELMESYFGSGRPIRLVVQLLDLRHPPSKDDRTMLDFLVSTGYPFLIALTKADKLGPMARAKRMEELESELNFLPEEIRRIALSATTGEGIPQLKAAIEAVL